MSIVGTTTRATGAGAAAGAVTVGVVRIAAITGAAAGALVGNAQPLAVRVTPNVCIAASTATSRPSRSASAHRFGSGPLASLLRTQSTAGSLVCMMNSFRCDPTVRRSLRGLLLSSLLGSFPTPEFSSRFAHGLPSRLAANNATTSCSKIKRWSVISCRRLPNSVPMILRTTTLLPAGPMADTVWSITAPTIFA